MTLKSRWGALFAFVLCGGMVVSEWLLRTRAGIVHPMVLLVAGAGVMLSLTGMVAPHITEVTPEGRLSLLANKIGLVGLAIGGTLWYLLR